MHEDTTQAHILDANTGKKITVLDTMTPIQAFTAKLTPDGRYAVSADGHNVVSIYQSDTGQKVGMLSHSSCIIDVLTSNRFCITVDQDNLIRAWDLGQALNPASPKPAGETNACKGKKPEVLCLSPNALIVAAQSPEAGHTLRMFRLPSLDQAHEVKNAHEEPINEIRVDPSGKYVVTASLDGTCVSSLKHPNGRISKACFSPDAKHIIMAADTGDINVWDREKERFIARHRREGRKIRDMSIQPKEIIPGLCFVVTIDGGGAAHLLEAATGKPLMALHDVTDPAVSAGFFEKGAKLLTAGRDGRIHIIDLRENPKALEEARHLLKK